MSLTIEISPETEARLRELATREQRDLSAFLVEAASEKADWLENGFSPAQETELDARLELYRRDGNAGRSWAQVRAELVSP